MVTVIKYENFFHHISIQMNKRRHAYAFDYKPDLEMAASLSAAGTQGIYKIANIEENHVRFVAN